MRRYLKRSIAVLLTLALVLVIPFAMPQQASAASKNKTKYVPVKISIKSVRGGNTTSESINIKYNKKGFRTKYPDGKAVLNSKGYPKKIGPFTYKYKYNKKGLPVVINQYHPVDGLNGLYSVTKYTYYSNGKVKSEVRTDYDEYGVFTTIFNRKGNVIKEKSWFGTSDYDITTHTLKYNKKGYVSKDTAVTTSVFEDDVFKETYVTTYKYKYGKKKTIKQAVATTKEAGTKIVKSKETYTFKYKKVKVPKKMMKAFDMIQTTWLAYMMLYN